MNIAIAGGMGSGKTTVAKYLVDKYDFWKYALADYIKEIAREIRLFNSIEATNMIYKMVGENYLPIYLDVFKLCNKCQGKSNRWLYQVLGTDIVRKYKKNVWVEHLYEQIMDKPFVVIDDVRFKNELKFFKDRDYVTIKIECYATIPRLMKRDGYVEGLKHVSETELDNATFDYTIDNNGTLEELYQQVDNMIGRYRSGYIDESN